MTISGFLEALDLAKASFHWKMDGNGKIRGYKDDQCFCPLTAVILHRKNRYHDIGEAVIAARLNLYMLAGDGQRIIYAADLRYALDTLKLRDKIRKILEL